MERHLRNRLGAWVVLVLVSALLLVGGTTHAASAQPGTDVGLVDETLTNWSSNLPVVIIDTSGQEIMKETDIGVSVRLMDPGKPSARAP